MPKYRVYLVSTASAVVEVEAEDGEQAVENAFEGGLPYADASAGFDLGDWSLPSEVYGSDADPQDDYEEIED